MHQLRCDREHSTLRPYLHGNAVAFREINNTSLKRYHFRVPLGRLNFLDRWAVKILGKVHPNQYLAGFQIFPQISHLCILGVYSFNMFSKFQWRLGKLCHKLILSFCRTALTCLHLNFWRSLTFFHSVNSICPEVILLLFCRTTLSNFLFETMIMAFFCKTCTYLLPQLQKGR